MIKRLRVGAVAATGCKICVVETFTAKFVLLKSFYMYKLIMDENLSWREQVDTVSKEKSVAKSVGIISKLINSISTLSFIYSSVFVICHPM